MSLAGNEIFSIEELQGLTLVQLERVSKYLGIGLPDKPKKASIINSIMEFQRRSVNVGGYYGNPDWADGVPRSVRVQRIYEANKAGRRI